MVAAGQTVVNVDDLLAQPDASFKSAGAFGMIEAADAGRHFSAARIGDAPVLRREEIIHPQIDAGFVIVCLHMYKGAIGDRPAQRTCAHAGQAALAIMGLQRQAVAASPLNLALRDLIGLNAMVWRIDDLVETLG